ncbi:glycosyltransferase [Candidatus Methylospira mobilis]|uniref:glycosyltransferase n=1 Tax=Candidatus Methylospira mobilis TaxID=1808979 RepID=UPI0028ECC619|nr:glycosyltransferase [Candidatus Methylospira mobilis]WNV06082.1 glycosyltransferase [Candidatus Methylospira mobilis]
MQAGTGAPDMALPWYGEESPQVSIIVLNFNKAHLTIACLKSIWAFTQGYRYEIIVVDNGSQLEDFKALSAFTGRYKLLRLGLNRFFGEGNNIGAETAAGEFVLFMNNDVIVTPNWLQPLMDAFNDHADCGVAGPKFVYPDNRLQECGAMLDDEGGALQIGQFQDSDSPRFNVGREVDYVSAAAALMRKTTFEDALGFDLLYEPAYYEDADLCLKVNRLGFKTYFVPESCVIHYANATTSDPTHGLQLNNILAINRDKFVGRWSGYLKTRRHDGGTTLPIMPPVIEGSERDGRPTAAVFTPFSIALEEDERFLLATAELLILKGYQVCLVLPEKYSYLRITKIAAILGLSLQGLSIATVQEFEAQPSVDVFVAMGNEITPSIKAMGRESFYYCRFPFLCAPDENDLRLEWMSKYQAIIVGSDFIREVVEKRCSEYSLPNRAVHVINPPAQMYPFGMGESRSRSIVSVGRFYSGERCEQQNRLIKAFRRLYESDAQAELHLLCSVGPKPQHREFLVECRRLAEDLPVYFHIDATHDLLEQVYKTASVYWHGAGFGVDAAAQPEQCEYFGVSVVDAMSAGLIPLVAGNGGPAHIVRHGWSGFCYESEAGLVDLTRKIFDYLGLMDEMRKNAHIRALDFSREAFVVRWQTLLS